MRIACWNVNSISVRLPLLLQWLRDTHPDVVLLQEIKTIAENFPGSEIEAEGYNFIVWGQKSFNGVAILSRERITIEHASLSGDSSDQQARYIEALIEPKGRTPIRVASIYLPNGNPIESEKFPYKLAWMDRLQRHVEKLLAYEEPLVLGGDYNLAPTDRDVYDPEAWQLDALCHPLAREKFRKLCYLGLTDAYRAIHPLTESYSYWDYKGNRFDRNEGLRIDHLLLSPEAADRLLDAGIDLTPRAWERPSDHTPVWCKLQP